MTLKLISSSSSPSPSSSSGSGAHGRKPRVRSSGSGAHGRIRIVTHLHPSLPPSFLHHHRPHLSFIIYPSHSLVHVQNRIRWLNKFKEQSNGVRQAAVEMLSIIIIIVAALDLQLFGLDDPINIH
jgi:hypothetical protein